MQTGGETSRQKLLIYSDEGVLAAGAASVLGSISVLNITIAGQDLAALVPTAQRVAPDLVLLGLTPGMTVGFLSVLRQAASGARLILWDREISEELSDKMQEIGNCCFLRRGSSTQDFLDSFKRIATGAEPDSPASPEGATRVDLTSREAQLVTLLVQGLRNKEIAACLGITEGTVRIYMTKLFAKVGARDRFELAIFGMQNLNCGHAYWDGHNAFVTETDEERARPALKSLLLVEPKRRKGYLTPV